MTANNSLVSTTRGTRLVRYTLTAALIVMSSHAFAEECAAPKAPSDMPSGKKATKDEMIAAQGKVKEFDAATTTYTSCLQAETDAAMAKLGQSETDPKKLEDKKKKLQGEETKKQNAAIDKDKEVAGKFNDELRAYKAQAAKPQ
jgi:hypothetical protein